MIELRKGQRSRVQPELRCTRATSFVHLIPLVVPFKNNREGPQTCVLAVWKASRKIQNLDPSPRPADTNFGVPVDFTQPFCSVADTRT